MSKEITLYFYNYYPPKKLYEKAQVQCFLENGIYRCCDGEFPFNLGERITSNLIGIYKDANYTVFLPTENELKAINWIQDKMFTKACEAWEDYLQKDDERIEFINTVIDGYERSIGLEW